MTSLIFIYFSLIVIQRAVSFLFADFPYISIFVQQIFGVFAPVFIYFEFIKKERYIEKSDIKIKIYDVPILFFAGFCMQFFGSFINYPVILLLDKLSVTAPKMESVPEDSRIFIYIFLICVLPAIFEEVLFRKLTFSVLSKYGKIKALTASAVIFGLIHFNIYSVVPLTLAGFILTFIIFKGYPLIYTMLFHFLMNFSGIIFDFITRSDKASAIINNYFLLFGLISGFLIFAFICYIKNHILAFKKGEIKNG